MKEELEKIKLEFEEELAKIDISISNNTLDNKLNKPYLDLEKKYKEKIKKVKEKYKDSTQK